MNFMVFFTLSILTLSGNNYSIFIIDISIIDIVILEMVLWQENN